jgi:hypothetical protein
MGLSVWGTGPPTRERRAAQTSSQSIRTLLQRALKQMVISLRVETRKLMQHLADPLDRKAIPSSVPIEDFELAKWC